jgi:cytochrome P450
MRSRRFSSVPWDLPAFALDPPGFLLRRAVSGGPIAPLRLGRRTAYVVAGPAEVQQILTQQRAFPKGMAHDPSGPEPGPPLALAFGNGLLSSSGRHHARQRRLMQPAFSHGSVAGYADRMLEEAERFTATLHDGQELDLTAALSEVTLRILTRTVFDTPLPPADIAAIRSAVTAGQSLAGVRGLIRARNRAGVERLMPLVRQAMAPANEVIARLVAERLDSESAPSHESPRDDLLSVLLQAIDEETGERMTQQDVQDEVLTLLLAGHETTTNALSWTFALLATHPAAQVRLQDEVDAAYGDGRRPTGLALTELAWTSACLDEAMRLYPPAWLVLRHTDQPVRIGSEDVPAGSTLIVSPFVTQRIPALWPDADTFQPARFAPGGAAYPARRRPLAAYLPFGGGPRICIGEHFALLEARVVLAVFTRDWVARLTGGGVPAYRPRITLGPKGGLAVRLTARR